MQPLRISIPEVIQRKKSGEFLVFVDARPAEFWEASHFKLPGAVRIPPGEVAAHLDGIAAWHPLVIYCCLPEEEASMQVARELRFYNLTRTRPLRGGYDAWCEAGLPLDPK